MSIDIQQPKDDTLLNTHSTVLSIAVNDNGTPVNSAEYSLDDGGTWAPFDGGSAGQLQTVIPLPTADGVPFPIAVRASGLSNTAVVTVTPIVDNVAPQPNFPVADKGRLAPRDFRIVFSEPVLPEAGKDFVLTPDAGPVVWSSDHLVAEWPSLAPDTIYSLSLPDDTVRDLAGNPNVAVARTFRTEPATPANGSVISVGTGWLLVSFDAASNSDGIPTVVMLAAQQGGNQQQKLVWGTFDPLTGGFLARDVVPWSSTAFNIEYHPRTYVEPVFDASRTEGFDLKYTDGGTSLVRAFFFETDGGPTQAMLADAGILVPAGPGSGETGFGAVAWSGYPGPVYVRPGSAPQALTLDPTLEAIVSPDQWEWDTVSANNFLLRTLHTCDGSACSFSTAGTVITNVDPTKPVTIAATPARTLYVYTQTTGTQVEHCDQCVHADGGCANPQSEPSTGATNLLVAAAHDNLIIGARSDGGSIELLERDLGESCDSPWEVVGAIDAGTATFRPVMFGSKPGLLYQPAGDTSDIDVYVP